MSTYPDDGLATISQSGEVPATRMKDAASVQDFVRRMVTSDSKRSFKRSRVSGLVNGNPPYSAERLKAAGRADAANVNWGIARSYLEASVGAFYDLFSEAPGYVSFRTSYGPEEKRKEWSTIASKEADLILKKDKLWDYQMQVSQWDMVLHGCGPFLFEDNYTILPKAFLCGDLVVPEFTKSDTGYWDACAIKATYYPPELYAFIQDAKAASAVGWDVEHVKKVIANAMSIKRQNGAMYQWEFYEQELKNNSIAYYNDAKVCKVAHVFWKEFDGRITHSMVERETTSELPPKYLYLKTGRYRSFQECIHPMYFDHGNGGFHHSVTGLGVKMYSAMEYENRLICNLADKAFSPKTLFKPTTTEGTQRFQLAQHGDFAVLPQGYDAVQNPMNGYMNEGLEMHQAISGIMQSNLSSYRQQVPAQKSGNPATKFQKQLEAAQQSALNKTQFNRYYQQLDTLLEEIWRRLVDPNSTDDRAKEFQKKCKDQGVPIEALNRSEYVQATRVVGQGSQFMRKSAIDSIFPIAGSLPEDGRANLIDDKIAAEAGQYAVERYNPKKAQTLPTDQQAEALQWTAAMKVGVPPVVTSSQNPVTYAATFLKAGTDALQSLQQGGNPMEVLTFLEICGPAIAAQLQRFAQDPTRVQVHQAITQQWEQLAKTTDQLKQHIQQQQEQEKAQQQATQQTMNEEQLKQAKTQNDIQLKTAKTQQQLKQSEEKHQQRMQQAAQNMALKDATTAHGLKINQVKTAAEIAADKAKQEQATTQE